MKSIRNKILPMFLTGALISVIGSCGIKIETSETLYESAIVREKKYIPSSTTINCYPEMDGGGINCGLDTDPEEYCVKIESEGLKIKSEGRCGLFEICGEEGNEKSLYEKLQEGQNIDVFYKNVYRSKYEDIYGDGTKDLVSRILLGCEFVDAKEK
jgi:hypothetical protein